MEETQCTRDSSCQIYGHTIPYRTAEWNPAPLNGQKITTWREHIELDPVPKVPSAGRIEAAQRGAEEYADRHRDELGITNEAGGIMLQLVDIIEILKQNLRTENE